MNRNLTYALFAVLVVAVVGIYVTVFLPSKPHTARLTGTGATITVAEITKDGSASTTSNGRYDETIGNKLGTTITVTATAGPGGGSTECRILRSWNDQPIEHTASGPAATATCTLRM